MQVVSPFVIELIYKGSSETVKISSFEFANRIGLTNKWFNVVDSIPEKPIGFKLLELRLTEDSIKFTNWLQHEFKARFDYDPLMWLASVGTFPAEFHKYLIPFNTTKDP